MPVLTREQAFDILKEERDYQKKHSRNIPSMAGELMTLKAFHSQAVNMWCEMPNECMVYLHKIGTIAMGAMETYGGFSVEDDFANRTRSTLFPEGTDHPFGVFGPNEVMEAETPSPVLTQEEVFSIVSSVLKFDTFIVPLKLEVELLHIGEHITVACKSYQEGNAYRLQQSLRSIAATVVRAIMNHELPNRPVK